MYEVGVYYTNITYNKLVMISNQQLIISTLYNSGEFEAAKQLALVMLKTDGNNIELINTLAGCYYELRDYKPAAQCMELLYEKAHIRNEAIRTNYAKVLYYLRRAPEALDLISSLITKDPYNTDIGLDYALYTNAVGDFESGYSILQQLDQSDGRVQFNLGWHLLRHDLFLEGFEHLAKGTEHRVWGSESQYDLPKRKRLTTTTDVRGKIVLMANEGGQGDEILFARFAQILKQRGASVTMACSPQLMSIFSSLIDVDKTINIKNAKKEKYDYYLPSMNAVSIMQLLSPIEDITCPYLAAKNEYVKSAKKHLKAVTEVAKPLIALRWQGNQQFEHDQFRSVPFKKLLKFKELGNLYSIQRDSGLEEMRVGDPIVDLSDKLTSWDITLGYIQNMDYVVTSCTSIAHAAAAMGKKVCVLLPLVPYFPWATLQQTSEWYPTVNLFRQTVYNSWDEPIQACFDWIKQDMVANAVTN